MTNDFPELLAKKLTPIVRRHCEEAEKLPYREAKRIRSGVLAASFDVVKLCKATSDVLLLGNSDNPFSEPIDDMLTAVVETMAGETAALDATPDRRMEVAILNRMGCLMNVLRGEVKSCLRDMVEIAEATRKEKEAAATSS